MGSLFDSVLFALVSITISYFVKQFSEELIRKRRGKQESTLSEKIDQSIKRLRDASRDMDIIMNEVVNEISKRNAMLVDIVKKSDELKNEEQRLLKRIESMKKVEPDAVAYFEQINTENLKKLDRRQSWRDLIFLFVGILITSLIAIIIKNHF